MAETKIIDKRILLLQFFGILFVVLGHTGNGISLFSDWFPYSSFHMALFIFISGYLYKENSENRPFNFVWRKVKSLVIPLYVWQLVYAILWNVLNYYELLQYGEKPTIKNFFICPWTYGPRYGLTEAPWFISTLFLIHAINVLLRKILNISKRKTFELIYFMILLIGGNLAVIAARKIGGLSGGMSQFQSMTIKVGFLFPFYQMGHIFKKWIGGFLDDVSDAIYLLIVMSIQMILIYLAGGTSGLYNTVVQSRYPSPIISYLGACTGILFWFKLTKIITPSLGENKIIFLVDKNTLSIVIHHQLGIYIINWILYGIKSLVGRFGDLSMEHIKTKYWYTYAPDGINVFKIVYLIGSISFSLGIEILWKQIRRFLLILMNQNR